MKFLHSPVKCLNFTNEIKNYHNKDVHGRLKTKLLNRNPAKPTAWNERAHSWVEYFVVVVVSFCVYVRDTLGCHSAAMY